MESELDWTKVFTTGLFKSHGTRFLSPKDRGRLSATSKSIREVMQFTIPELQEDRESIGKELVELETTIARLQHAIENAEQMEPIEPRHPKLKGLLKRHYELNPEKYETALQIYTKALADYKERKKKYDDKLDPLKEKLTQAEIRMKYLSPIYEALKREIERRKAKSSQKGESRKTKRTRKRRSLKRRSLKKLSRKRRSLKRRSLKRRSRK
mgnify:CR=1 FL=1|tara:strand:- start:21 stop:653 length:633 start_codon:yes stop_codon:yes gene_type:complete